MEAKRWQRLEGLYYRAAETQASERERFLLAECPEDPDLRAEVLSLLQGSSGVTQSVAAAVGLAAEHLTKSSELRAGEWIGSYQIIEKLGQGGMGTVYLARREDKQYRKDVAIKLIRKGLDDPGLISRFRAERQILANLEHPNIARLLDGGITAEGRHYFVMEYVDGVPIDEYVQSRSLSLTERLALFRIACQAVMFAHRSLIIHRDLKPANLLVSSSGTVKLLDFGIAKLQEAEHAGVTIPLTRFAANLLTPDYASPEQVRGESITTATDVYSLGMLLYQLLTSVRPYKVEQLTPAQIERLVCEFEPLKPSVAAKGNDVSFWRRLAGDMDNICMKALHKDPQRRYASVDRFDEDLRRYLEGLPVEARRDTLAYRTGKFVRRHAGVVTLAGLLAASLVVLAIGSATAAGRLKRERDNARQQEVRAQQVSAFLVELFKVSDPYKERANSNPTARDMLDRAAVKIKRELAGQPKTEAALFDTMAQVYENLGLMGSSIPLLESSLRLKERTLGSNDPDVATAEYRLAHSLFYADEDYPRETMLAKKSLDIRRRRFGENSLEVADCLELLGNVNRIGANYGAAEELTRRAYEIVRQRLGEENLRTADASFDLADVLFSEHDREGAEKYFREALRVRMHLLSADDPRVLDSMEPVGYLLQQKGDLNTAEEIFRKILNGRRKMLSPMHLGIATATNHLASVLEATGRSAEAATLYLQAIEIDRKSVGEWNVGTAITIGHYADLLRKTAKFGSAEERYRECISIYQRVLPELHPYLAGAEDGMALNLLAEKKTKEADAFESKALEIRERLFGESDGSVLTSLNHLGKIRDSEGQAREAHALYAKACKGARKSAAQRNEDEGCLLN